MKVLFHPIFIQKVSMFALASQEIFFPSFKTMNNQFMSMIVTLVAGLDEWSRGFRTINVSKRADLSHHLPKLKTERNPKVPNIKQIQNYFNVFTKAFFPIYMYHDIRYLF